MATKIKKALVVTDPVVEGGSYEHAITGETGTMIGTSVDANSGAKYGNLYTYTRGMLPTQVIENHESMLQWKLKRAGSDKTATGLVGAHRRKFPQEEEESD